MALAAGGRTRARALARLCSRIYVYVGRQRWRRCLLLSTCLPTGPSILNRERSVRGESASRARVSVGEEYYTTIYTRPPCPVATDAVRPACVVPLRFIATASPSTTARTRSSMTILDKHWFLNVPLGFIYYIHLLLLLLLYTTVYNCTATKLLRKKKINFVHRYCDLLPFRIQETGGK